MVSTLLQLGVYNYIVGLLLTLTIHLLWMYVAGKKFNIYTNDIFSDVAIGVGICTVINVFDNRKDYNGADIAFSLLTSLPCGFILSTYYFMELLGVSPMLALGIFALSFTTALGIFFAAVSLYNPVIIISGRIMVICGIAGISIFNELNIVYVLFISTVCLFIINRSFHYPFLRFRAVYHQLYPLSWDENIALPIWFLPKKIRKDAKKNRSATIAFSMMLLRERPLHRKSAQKGLFYIACDTLIAFKSLEDLSKTRKSLSFMPEEFPEEYSQPFSHLIEESRNIQQALNNYNPSNRIREIRKAQVRLQEFEKEMNYTRDKEAREFEKLAQAWLVLIHKYLQENEHNLPLPNPFVTGPALKAKEETFVGREDILNEIKTEALKEGAAGAILFLGNRRTGKTSTLYNLPQVLPSDIQAHYFDAQDIRMKSEQGFYRQLLKSFGSIEINNEADFTALTDFFEAQDAKLKEENKLALVCLDEYERFADLAHFPDTLRYWIQHLNNIVFLLAGSYELDENKADEPNAS
ncbi:MAG: ATP-binding protein, partial [Bacteroidota bacterium]